LATELPAPASCMFAPSDLEFTASRSTRCNARGPPCGRPCRPASVPKVPNGRCGRLQSGHSLPPPWGAGRGDSFHRFFAPVPEQGQDAPPGRRAALMSPANAFP
jgi:hypothetical protein